MKEGKIPSPITNPNPETETALEFSSDKISKELQEEYLSLVEKRLMESRNEESIYDRKLLESERKLEGIFTDKNKPPSFIDRIRESKKVSVAEQRVSEKVWIVIDFDDVINKTTTYHNFLKEKICLGLGMEEKEFEKLYDESKIVNNEGKKVLRFEILVEKIKSLNPGKVELVSKLLTEGINPNEFIDQGMKRSLMMLADSSKKNQKDTRISVLTFGDINYQKGRIDKTDVDNIVDDIIYTEGSKREVLEALLESDYKNIGIIPPLVITLDDSKEQIKDYSGVNLPNNFINMHYKNPQGKKSMEESGVEQVVSVTEKDQNVAALDFYRICKLCLQQNMQSSREELHNAFNGKDVGSIYHTIGILRSNDNKIIKRTDSHGIRHTVILGNNYDGDKEDPFNSEITDNDGYTRYDYYMSIKNPLYIPSQSNIRYSKDSNGKVFRNANIKTLQKNKSGEIEETVSEKIDNVFIDKIKNKELLPIFSTEEFIKNAK